MHMVTPGSIVLNGNIRWVAAACVGPRRSSPIGRRHRAMLSALAKLTMWTSCVRHIDHIDITILYMHTLSFA